MYRETKSLDLKHYNILLHQGGLGDLISHLPAIKYTLDNHPHIMLHLWIHDYGVPLCKKTFQDYPNIIIRGLSELEKKYKSNLYTRSPYAHKISNVSAHSVDHGFYTITHRTVEDKYKNYIQLEPIDVSGFNLPEKYVVITTGFTSETREWLPESVNGVTDYVIKKGYVPVYIGKSFSSAMVTAKSNVGTTGKFKCDYSKGIDLIDMTNILEAHAIMDQSSAVIGLDNGLCHLAAMGKAKIVIGFTTVDPLHRLPYRDNILGKDCYVVTPTKKELACIHCQSNMTFASTDHCFTKCFYKDYKCLQLMTADKWIEQLEKIL
jgi:ADP-heptose:LPS heptosyltransferase